MIDRQFQPPYKLSGRQGSHPTNNIPMECQIKLRYICLYFLFYLFHHNERLYIIITTTQLSWYVQNFVLIRLDFFKLSKWQIATNLIFEENFVSTTYAWCLSLWQHRVCKLSVVDIPQMTELNPTKCLFCIHIMLDITRKCWEVYQWISIFL